MGGWASLAVSSSGQLWQAGEPGRSTAKRLVTQNASLPVEGVRGPTNGVMVEMRDPKEEEKTPQAEGRERYIIGYCLPFSPSVVLSFGW